MLPFICLVYLNSKVKLSKSNRSRQFLTPIITFCYCIIAAVYFEKIQNMFDTVCRDNNIGFVNDLSVLCLNTLLVLGNIIIKAITLPFLNHIWRSNTVMMHTASIFYDYNDDVDKWFLDNKYVNLRGYCKGFFFAFSSVSILIFILGIKTESPAFSMADFPFFGILILYEIICYLSGMTKKEFVEDVLGENEDSYKIANYGLMRKILRELFGDRVLYENTLDNSDCISDTFDSLSELAQSENHVCNMMGEYFLELKKNGEHIDINYVRSSINLLQGRSTLFNNPFYRDMTSYIIIPIIKQLINYNKCLIVVGRDSAVQDVTDWINDGVLLYTGAKSLWKTRILDKDYEETDIGIVRFSDIFNLDIHGANKEFLHDVGFVLLIEPSRILASGQMGLNLLVSECESSEKEIVYCACDRNCDGLVDALSHILKTNITEVTATPAGSPSSSQMYWNADGGYMHHKILPDISRYLGIGTEIISAAFKYQINNTVWISSEKFPVFDMKWIDGQYYKEICNYANLPVSQEAFNRCFSVERNLWSCQQKDNLFMVIEDEFQNLFEATRTYASRATKQGFLNIISENYFLRDYMLDNVNIFSADPKAIPTIVPDYARTERNTALKLIMMMVYAPVSEKQIEKELMICGIKFEDAYETLKELIKKHCAVEDPSASISFKEKILDDSINTITEKYYGLEPTNELYDYAKILKNAYFIAEDEQGEKHYISAKLYGHVYQAMLPGQFMTFNGKYYEVKTITPLNGVVVRRAADHISDRRYYKQIRTIKMHNFTESTEMGGKKKNNNIELINGFAELNVKTDGYIEMTSYGDLKNARSISVNNIPDRNYKNKSILKIKLCGMTDKVRATICILLNEVFRTTYPDTYHYIYAAAPTGILIPDELKGLLYNFEGECEDDAFYIIEDSEVDLGLIVSVERNLDRYLGIVYDVLSWHRVKMEEKPKQEIINSPEVVFESQKAETKKRKLIDIIKDILIKLRIKHDKDSKPGDDAIETSMPQNVSNVIDEEQSEVLNNIQNMEEDISGDDEEIKSKMQTEYQTKCFLKFGFDSVSDVIAIPETIEFLTGIGADNNPLTRARTTSRTEEYNPHKYGTHYCDFCGVDLGGEYEVLQDGRERCNRCSMTAVRTLEGFKKIYKGVERNMEVFYNIKLNTAIKVRMTDAKKIAKKTGMPFVATPGFDARVLGFARSDKTGYSIFVENGSPKLAAISTIAHEMTHIWQYLYWDKSEIEKKYGKENVLEIYEGMAKWAELQYLILLGETEYAKRQEVSTRMRDDEYGRGFIKYADKYPLSYETSIKNSPFNKQFPL